MFFQLLMDKQNKLFMREENGKEKKMKIWKKSFFSMENNARSVFKEYHDHEI